MRRVGRVMVTGASGLLGGHVRAVLGERGIEHVVTSGVDLSDEDAAAAIWRAAPPDTVLHCAATSAMSDCARDPARARRVNVGATENLARLAAGAGARLVCVSTDLVFDGERAPYREGDPRSPISTYGRTKADAERAALEVPRAAVARLALLFGPSLTARIGFFDAQLAALRAGRAVSLFVDEWRTPLSLRAAAEALVAIAASELEGIVHVAGPERMSRAEMGLRLARWLGVSEALVTETSQASVPSAPGERRPRDVSLDAARLSARFGAVAARSYEEELDRTVARPAARQ